MNSRLCASWCVSDSWINVSPAKWSASPCETTIASISSGVVAEDPRRRLARKRAKSLFSPPSIVITRPCGVWISVASPCWTSTNETRSTCTSAAGTATSRSLPSMRILRFRKPLLGTGWRLPPDSTKSNVSTSIRLSSRLTMRTGSPHARIVFGLSFSSRSTAKSTLIVKSWATSSPCSRFPGALW